MAGSSSNLEFRSLSRDQVGFTAGVREEEWSEETPFSLLESPRVLSLQYYSTHQKYSVLMECSSHRRDAITNLKTQET